VATPAPAILRKSRREIFLLILFSYPFTWSNTWIFDCER
jgi:hypothetical protein